MTSDAAHELDRGEKFDRYEVLGRIASGGMGSVYLGQSLGVAGFRRYVAIKRLHPQFVEDPQIRDMFLDEAHIAARLRHPNVVSTLDFGETAAGLYLVLEFVEGPSLLRIMNECRSVGEAVPLAIALRILTDVLEGLGAAHALVDERGQPLSVVHRDVTPHNVLVGADGSSRVTDFGVARAARRVSETRTGELKGKFSYFAPEQLTGTVDARADLFAAGIVLWELLAGRKLFSGENDYAVAVKVISEPIPDIREIRPEVPDALAEVLHRALQRAVDLRYPSAVEFADALARAADKAGLALANTRTAAAFVERHGGKTLQPLRAMMRESLDRAAPVYPSARHPPQSGEIPVLGEDVVPRSAPRAGFTAPDPVAESRSETGLRARLQTLPAALPPPVSTPVPVTLPVSVPVSVPKQSSTPALARAQELLEIPYTTSFEFDEVPFREVREPERFWYAGPFSEASDALLAAVEATPSPIVLVGECGSGRTFLLETQALRVHASRAVLVNPSLLFGQSIAHAAAISFGLVLDPTMPPALAFDSLLNHVIQTSPQLSTLFFCVDGVTSDIESLMAELLPIARSAPQWVRLVISTEPAFAHDLRSFCRRSVVIRAMTAAEVQAYVEDRLARVARGRPPALEAGAFPFLHARSGGLVRKVGVFVHNALQVAACTRSAKVTIDALRIGMKSKIPLSPSDACTLLASEGQRAGR